ncbi:hypothetical protein ACFXJ8_17930 [Nonomuraea sp. NPDC059194]|uniref:hypothetical protein n=1 Tax=Nonomuraea sp. NPDC059194 TaxID=3346764 RepID=UPI0036CE5F60
MLPSSSSSGSALSTSFSIASVASRGSLSIDLSVHCLASSSRSSSCGSAGAVAVMLV